MNNQTKTNFSLLLAAVASLGPVAMARAVDDSPADASRSETAQALLAGESWQKTMNGLNEWFSVQPIYEPKEVEAIKEDLSGRVKMMSPNELLAFQQDLDAKLEMVLGPDGRDILGWVAASWAAASPAYRKKMDVQYPDVTKLTAAQLREQLDLLEQKRSSAKNQTARIEQSRQARIAALQADQRQQFQERERALDRGASGSRTPYHPGGVRQYPDVVARPAYGFGWGFGFW
jgi:hypothetical protein